MIDKAVENQLASFLTEAMQQIVDENFSSVGGRILSVTKQQEFDKCNQFMLITICSFNFKCLVMLHFSDDDKFQNLIYQQQPNESEQETAAAFLDKLGEMCNVLSGTLKRKLEYTFSCIGMSTPQLLSHYSMDVFLHKSPDSIIHLKSDLGDKYVIIASAVLFLDRNIQFKLKASTQSADYLDQGDLILF